MEFSQKDLQQIQKHNLTAEEVNRQLEDFQKGFPFISLYKPATIGDGIRKYSDDQQRELIDLYESSKDNYRITKFVPSSGAATRMMKDYYSFLSLYKDEKTTPLDNFPTIKQAIENIYEFAFVDNLQKALKKDNLSLENCLQTKDYRTIIEYIVSEKGLSYGKYPKAWIVFHKDKEDNHLTTSFEEHLKEAMRYATSHNEASLHFTITKDHLSGFEKLQKELVPKYEKQYGVKINITFSFQQQSTDTIAVDMENKPIYNQEGSLVFRPAGHGALINNLQTIDSDIVFIKNIDNVSSLYSDTTAKYKKLLAGVLIQTKNKVNSLITKLQQESTTEQELLSIAQTIRTNLCMPTIKDPTLFPTLTEGRNYLLEILNRPIRVCGMVKNTGEPGGGPYFVYNSATDMKDSEKGTNNNQDISLQIVEKAQMNVLDNEVKELVGHSTHFNPVDLVVNFKDSNGKSFLLSDYIDSKTGFITEKSFEGKQIKAMERPGLWNGAMAKWITIFVEVPLETFTPVKTLNDLLRKEHK